jgi:hypothetical protein
MTTSEQPPAQPPGGKWPLDSLRSLQFQWAVDHATIIERLGGYRFVAKRIKRDPTTVFRWQSTGIPAEHWPAILRLARRREVELSLDAIARSSPIWSNADKPAA